jgi:alpha-tubulin suppressor-like RCC1 family protein
MNVLLIHEQVRDYIVFVESVNQNTKAILYRENTDLLQELPEKVEQLGIVFVKGMTFMGKSFFDQVDLFNEVIATRQIKRIDFLACETLPDWSDFYSKLNTVVGASRDKTGNLNYGGNWVMESTGQDIESVYFTRSIEYYKYLLDYQGDTNLAVIRDDGRLWMKGDNQTGQMGGSDLYIKKLKLIDVPFNSSSKIVGGGYATYVLTNGILYGTGLNSRKSLTNQATIVEKQNTYFSIGMELEEFTVIPLPNSSPGLLTDVAGGKGCCILIDGKTYFTGDHIIPSFTNFTRIEIFDESGTSILATKIWEKHGITVALAEGKLYVIGGGGPMIQGTSNSLWVNMPFPVDASGTLTEVNIGNGYVLIVIGGILYGIGRNDMGQLGSMPKTDISIFRKATYDNGVISNAPAENVTQLSSYEHESMAVMNNQLYRVYNGTLTLINGITGTINNISRGMDHSLIVVDGVLYGYGSNRNVQLGLDIMPIRASGQYNSTQFNTPLKITNNNIDVSGVTQVLATDYCTFVVKSGQLYGMGNNVFGRLGIKRKLYSTVLSPLANKSGTILENITKVSYGSGRTLFVSNGSLYVSGDNTKGRLGIPFLSEDYFYQVDYLDDIYQPTLPITPSGPITFISHGGDCGAVVVKGGVVYNTGLFGGNTNGKFNALTIPAGNLEAISSGGDFVIFLIGGKLYGMGNNDNNRMGGTNTSYRYSVTSCDTATFTISDVTLVECGFNYTVFVQVDTVTNQHRIYAMGMGPWGPYSGIERISFPSDVDINTPIDAISGGDKFICVIFNKRLYGWGINDHNALYTTPGNQLGAWTRMEFEGVAITNATKVQCQSRVTTAVLGGKLYARGSNYFYNIAPTGNQLDWTLITEGLAGGSVTLETITPMSGTTNTQITVTGTLLNLITEIVLDTNSTTTVSSEKIICTINPIRTATSLTFTIPAGNGNKWIKFVTADKNYVATGVFAYHNPIVPLGFFISNVQVFSGTKNKILNIKADILTNLFRIGFNGVYTTSFKNISPTECSVILPDSTSGNVILEDIFGVSSAPTSAMYLQYANMSLTGLSITTGKVGDILVISGTNLADTDSVYFGNAKATFRPGSSPTFNSIDVVVPLEIGTVSVRVYDKYKNVITASQSFVYQLAPTQVTTINAIVQSSCIDASGQKYYAVLEGTQYFLVKYTPTNVSGNYTKLYSNGTTRIKGITTSNNLLYFCEPSTKSIKSISTTGSVTATTVLYRFTMIPEALKTDGTTLFIVCSNQGTPSNDAIVLATMNGTFLSSKPYSLFVHNSVNYSLQGITYYYNTTNTRSLFTTAVVYPITAATLTENTGRVFKLDANGTPINYSLSTGRINPIDITFVGAYLVVDGPIVVLSLDGEEIDNYDTTANSIFSNGDLISFTVPNSTAETSNIYEMAIPQYIPPTFGLSNEWSPHQGPVGTEVAIIGYNMTMEDISSVQIRSLLDGTIYTNITDYVVTPNQLFVRMPAISWNVNEKNIEIFVNYSNAYAFGYRDSDLINIIPFYNGNEKYYHFTGNNLENIQYIEFVDSTVSTLSENKIPVRNVTASYFDATIPTPPLNTARCLLLDSFANITIEDANYFTLSSETCFPGDTPILTDQGRVSIEKIDCGYHTIGKKNIVAITKIKYNGDTLIFLAKDSLRKNYPTRDTLISRKHKIYYKGKMKRAEQLVGKGAQVIPYKNQFLYNVLLKTHETMNVNGLICETLYPNNPICKFFN